MKPSYEIRVQRLNETPDAPKLETPETAYRYWQSVITTMPWYIPDREVCVAITLNTRYRVTGHSLISIGTLNESVLHCRDCWRAAIALSAYAIIVMHSHPSGVMPHPVLCRMATILRGWWPFLCGIKRAVDRWLLSF